MEIIYQGTDITDMVEISRCVVRDTAGLKCDSLEIEFENAAGWYRWGPKEDDTILVAHNGYDSGVMYVNTIVPSEDKFVIYATSLPVVARKREYRTFINKTLEEIIRTCAGLTGMRHGLYGVDGSVVIPYITQNNESCAAFLSKLLLLENAVLKCVNGKYAAIGLPYAQDREAVITLNVVANDSGSSYDKSGATTKKVTVKTPYCEASAIDSAVDAAHPELVINSLPAMNSVQAKRWAVGKLIHMNRQCEGITLQAEYTPAITAMERVDVTGNEELTGEWLVDDVTHDLMNLQTTMTLRRCLRTVH